jgi:hypothetical protein
VPQWYYSTRLNIAPEHQANANWGAVEISAQSDGQDRIAGYALNKTLRVVQEFTTDKDRLIRVASRTDPEQSPDERRSGPG